MANIARGHLPLVGTFQEWIESRPEAEYDTDGMVAKLDELALRDVVDKKYPQ